MHRLGLLSLPRPGPRKRKFAWVVHGVVCHSRDGIFCHSREGIFCHSRAGIFCHSRAGGNRDYNSAKVVSVKQLLAKITNYVEPSPTPACAGVTKEPIYALCSIICALKNPPLGGFLLLATHHHTPWIGVCFIFIFQCQG